MFQHGNIHAVYIFSLLGFLLLLVACINYVNLTTAKASLRSKEVSIRKVVGAARRQLFYQFIVESLLVSLIALAATLMLIWVCLPAFNGLTGKEFVQLAAESLREPPAITLLAPWMVRIGGWFDKTTSELLEMLYQYKYDYLFDSSKFEKAFHFSPTPYEAGIGVTANHFGEIAK